MRGIPAAVAVAVLALASCGGGDDTDATAVKPPAASGSNAAGEMPSFPAEATKAPAREVKSTRCQPVSAAMLDAIATGAEHGTGGIKLSHGFAVKSKDFEKLYMIAARITATGLDGKDVGIWASNSLEPGGGLIMAVDGSAKEFTDWPDGDETKADVKSTDDGADDAKDCAGDG